MPEVLERRLQRIREASYVITLPKDWVEEMGLKKGSTLVLCVEKGLARMYPSSRSPLRYFVVVDGMDAEDVRATVRYSYWFGADALTLSSREAMGQGLRDSVRTVRLELPGALVTSEDERSVTIEFAGDVVKDYVHALKIFAAYFYSTLRRFAGMGASADAVLDLRSYANVQRRAVSRELLRPNGSITVLEASLLSSYSDLCLSMTEMLPTILAGGAVTDGELLVTLGRALLGAVESYESNELRKLERTIREIEGSSTSNVGRSGVQGLVLLCRTAIRLLRDALYVRKMVS